MSGNDLIPMPTVKLVQASEVPSLLEEKKLLDGFLAVREKLKAVMRGPKERNLFE